MMPVKSQAPDSDMIPEIGASGHALLDVTLKSAWSVVSMPRPDRNHSPILFALVGPRQRLRYGRSGNRPEIELTETKLPMNAEETQFEHR
jgi:hypothetical protein